MATRAKKTALRSSTALTVQPVIEGEIVQDVDVVTGEIPMIGDNSTAQRDAMQEKQDAHNHLAMVLNDWAQTDVKVEYIRQQAAFDIMRRHATLASDDKVAPPTLATMALFGPKNANGRWTPNVLYSQYLTDLVNDFAGPYMSPKDCQTQEQLDAQDNRNMVNTRLDRALRLAVNLAWWKLDLNAFDMERVNPVTKEPIGAAWRTPPRAFIPPGYQCGPLLFQTADDGETPVPRPFVYLEADTKGKTYFAQTGSNSPDPITLSLTQFNNSTAKHIEVAQAGTTTDSGAKAQPQKRAAQQTVAKPENTEGTVETGASDAESVRETIGKPGVNRDWYIAQLNTALFTCDKLLNTDEIGVVKRADLSDGAWNAIENIAMIRHRIFVNEMQGNDTGSVAAKPGKRA